MSDSEELEETNEDNTEYMLTTLDNPYNPFTQFDEWFAFDESKGYHTCSYLDRVCVSSYDMSEKGQREAIQEAIDEIVQLNVLGIYRKVDKNSFDSLENDQETVKDEKL